MKDDDDKYLDPDQNPAIPHEDEPVESDDPMEVGLPFQMREKIHAGDLADKIKILFPKQPEIYVDDGISLVVQNSGDVEIIKPSKEKQGWDHTPLKDGTRKDLAIVIKFIDDKQK